MKKIPISVLIIVYTKNKNILLLNKKGKDNMWQSITGSLQINEKPLDAAKRELFEETGIVSNDIIDCKKEHIFEIYEMWRHKYEDDVYEHLRQKPLLTVYRWHQVQMQCSAEFGARYIFSKMFG